jgi:hypothetical protein
MNMARAFFLILLVLSLMACAVSGKDFVRPSGELLQLGKTTEKQVIAAMGDPKSTGQGQRRGKTGKHLMYSYGAASGGEVLYRAAYFYFVDEVLAGYQFTSSFPDESTDFDITKLGDIIEGQSTRENLEAILGPPSGEAMYPFSEDPEGRRIQYWFKGSKVTKHAIIELDKNDVVQRFDVELKPE